MMRTLFPLAVALFLAASVRADVPVPTPTEFSLTGLSNAAKYSFSYATAEGVANLQPIKAEQVYRAHKDIRLYVREGDGAPQQFDSLKHEYPGSKFVVHIEGVKRSSGSGKIEVQHRIEKTPPAQYRGNGPVRLPPKAGEPKSSDLQNAPGLPYFALAGVSLCGLVLMRRRK
jgi:hypothetical protein